MGAVSGGAGCVDVWGLANTVMVFVFQVLGCAAAVRAEPAGTARPSRGGAPWNRRAAPRSQGRANQRSAKRFWGARSYLARSARVRRSAKSVGALVGYRWLVRVRASAVTPAARPISPAARPNQPAVEPASEDDA